MRTVAVIGAGISGLAVSWLLSRRYRVLLFEKDDRLGGHTHTVVVEGQLELLVLPGHREEVVRRLQLAHEFSVTELRQIHLRRLLVPVADFVNPPVAAVVHVRVALVAKKIRVTTALLQRLPC